MSSLYNSDFKSYISSITSSAALSSLDCKYFTEQEFNANCKKFNNEICMFSLFHINIRSLNANHFKLQQLLLTLNLNFDIIALSEIWSYNISMYRNLFQNYKFFYVLPDNSNVGGIVAYIRSSILVNERNDIKSNLNYNSRECASESMFLELTKGDYRCILSSFYRHPNQNISKFTDLLDSIFQSALFAGKSCDYLVIGDSNVDLLKYDKNSEISRFIDMMIGYNFQPLSVIPSRFSNSTATLIDHVFYRSNYKYNIINYDEIWSGMLITDITDHLANFLILPTTKSQVRESERPSTRLFTPRNKKLFSDKLNTYDWEGNLYSCTDVDIMYDRFSSILFDAVEK